MIVAAPVLERLDGPLVIAGGGREAAYAELGDFVVALTARGVPLMPNGVGLAGDAPPAGASVTVVATKTWDPSLRLGDDPARRGAEILAAVGGEPPALLREAVVRRDPALAARAADELIGLGPGLTPEGDDLVAATAAVVAAGSWPEPERTQWLRALVPADLRRRTTALSATLLELAARGMVIEPLQALLGPDWRPALERLVRLGHSTGRAYATAAAAALAQAASTGRS